MFRNSTKRSASCSKRGFASSLPARGHGFLAPSSRSGHLLVDPWTDGAPSVSGLVWALGNCQKASVISLKTGDGVTGGRQAQFLEQSRLPVRPDVLDIRPVSAACCFVLKRVAAAAEPTGTVRCSARKNALYRPNPPRFRLLTSVPKLRPRRHAANGRTSVWPAAKIYLLPIPFKARRKRRFAAAVLAVGQLSPKQLAFEALVARQGGGSREDLPS